MRPFLIAEISSNHNNSLCRAKEMISVAHEAGFDAVKFQLFKIDQLFSSEILSSSKKHRDRRKWELPEEYIPELSKEAHKLDMKFGCTPFYIDAVKELEPFVDFFKVSSYEILWHDLMVACCDTGKPFIFSTGMSTYSEVEEALRVISKCKSDDITILKCTSKYPSSPKDINLQSIESLRKMAKKYRKKFKVGLSDHSRSLAVVLRAIHKYEVSTIELHIDLEGKGVEYGPGHCWLPDEIRKLKQLVDEGYISDGSVTLGPTISEQEERLWRADPRDGLRPIYSTRKAFSKKS